MLTWEGGGFEEERHLRALKRPWLQAGLRPFCPRPQASAFRAGSPERLALAQVVPCVSFRGMLKLSPFLSDGPGLTAHAPPLEVPLTGRIR